ncbi:MAG: Uma2 family endonuclease [Anaerolineae bacterium]|nr:Uma2 family endonuclease [Anaerolineae bacterium]
MNTRARIPEYWLVDPQMETITVLTLTDAAYIPHGIFRRGETAHARLLTGFTVAVDVVLDAALA